MTTLTDNDIVLASAKWAEQVFVRSFATARFSLVEIKAAARAIDDAFDTTLNAAVGAGFGASTIVQALNAIIPAPFSSATPQQKITLVCYVLMKRAGLI